MIDLMEIDGQTRLSRRPDAAGVIGEKLNLNYVCFTTDAKGLHAFGPAVLTRFEIAGAHFGRLPALYPGLDIRRRGALRSDLDPPAGRGSTSSGAKSFHQYP
jgi:hypothetical protein